MLTRRGIMDLDRAAVERIKATLRFHYGIVANEQEIHGIDEGLRNDYVVLHDQRIAREIVSRNINKILLKHRTKENVGHLERLFLHKSVFRYLTYASMSYRAGIPLATILLCRTAIESGLRERIAEKRADSNKTTILEEMNQLMNSRLSKMERIAEKEGIINNGELEKIFTLREGMKTVLRNPRKILDKYIHADFLAIVSVLEEIGMDVRVHTPKDPLEEKKIPAELLTNDVAVLILAATTRLAERLYLNEPIF